MRPVHFDYFRPGNAEEALARIAACGADGRFLAGGQSLVPLMNFRIARPSALIDLGRCTDLAYLRIEGDHLVCGSMTRQWDAEHDPLASKECPLIGKALSFAGYPAIRNRGTVGGSIAHADPVAELLAVASVLDAEMVIVGPRGKRMVPAHQFFAGELTTAIEAGELLCEIRFRRERPGSRSWFGEAGNHCGGMAQVAVAAYAEGRAGEPPAVARFSVIGLMPTPLRIPSLEQAITRPGFRPGEIAEALRADHDPRGALANLHGTQAYRRALALALLQDAVRAVAAVVTTL